jgi:hypothetical protein
MKKIIKILIVGLMLLSLSSCFSTKDNDEVAEAKRQL